MKSINVSFIIAVLVILQSSVSLFAQDRVVHGKVTCFENIPVVAANVEVKSTKRVVQTDTSGFFTVICNTGDKLKISATGFMTRRVKLGDSTKLVLVNLQIKEGDRNVEYAFGYGHIKEKDRTAAMSQINSKDHDFSTYSNMQQLIQGRFPGVQVSGNSINIRNSTSFLSGTEPLIIIDGTPSTQEILFSMSPIVVYSISIIKDGSAAMYGSRGANGVVIVETKTGRE